VMITTPAPMILVTKIQDAHSLPFLVMMITNVHKITVMRVRDATMSM
jgi:hypothetical protein